MTRDEFMGVVNEYKHLLDDVNLMRLKVRVALSELESQDELSKDEAEFKEWLKGVIEGLDGIRY